MQRVEWTAGFLQTVRSGSKMERLACGQSVNSRAIKPWDSVFNGPLQARVGPLSRSTAKELCRGHHCRHRWVRSVGPLHASFCDKHVGLTQEDEYFTGELTLGRICPPMHEMRVRFLGQERSPGEGNGNPLQYSCPGNPMDRGAWRATVHAVQSRTRLSTPAPARP